MKRFPKYRRHTRGKVADPNKDKGMVEWCGKRYYFPGPYNSKESIAGYRAFVRKIAVDEPAEVLTASVNPTINEIAEHYLDYIVVRHRESDDTLKPEVGHVRRMMGVLLAECGQLPLEDFGIRQLTKVRVAMHHVTRTIGKGDRQVTLPANWKRPYINAQVGRIRRFVAWAEREEYISTNVWLKLSKLEPLREGDSDAPEGRDVKPVDWTWVEAVMREVSPTLRTMIAMQMATGMRSTEVCVMRAADIDRSDPVAWIYRPERHKGKRRKLDRAIFLGPREQGVLAPFLESRGEEDYLFTPAETVSWKASQRWRSSKTRRRGKRKPLPATPRKLLPRYNAKSYRRGIMYGIARALTRDDCPPAMRHWHPHQVRHTVGTEVRAGYGLEGAQVVLGHKRADVTQVYAERNQELARRIVLDRGREILVLPVDEQHVIAGRPIMAP